MRRAYPTRVAPAPGGFVAVVANAAGDDVFRATFASPSGSRAGRRRIRVGSLADQSPAASAQFDKSLTWSAARNEPFGGDAFARMRRVADRIDRQARGYGLGEFTDSDAWTRVDAGDVAGLLTRFETPPFGLSEVAVSPPVIGAQEDSARTGLPTTTPAQRDAPDTRGGSIHQGPWAAQNAERDAGLFLRAVLYAMISPNVPASAKAYATAIGQTVTDGNEKFVLVLLSSLTCYVGKVHFLRDDPFADPAYLPYSRLLAAHFMNEATQCLPGPNAPRERFASPMPDAWPLTSAAERRWHWSRPLGSWVPQQ